MESEEKSAGSPVAQQVIDLHLATGLGLMRAKVFLEAESAELCGRIVRAHREQGQERRESLHDPIEDEAEFRERVEAAKAVAMEEHRALMAEEWPRGSCHRIWRLTKERLEEQGILWYSPAEMNPCSVSD